MPNFNLGGVFRRAFQNLYVRGLSHGGIGWMTKHRSKTLGKRPINLRRSFLIAKEQNFMLHQQLAHPLIDSIAGSHICQGHTADVSSQSACCFRYLNLIHCRHRWLPETPRRRIVSKREIRNTHLCSYDLAEARQTLVAGLGHPVPLPDGTLSTT